MVTPARNWDWDRVQNLLPEAVLEHMAATPPPLAHHGMMCRGGSGMRKENSEWVPLIGPEDIYHVLRYCVKVHELWGCLLGQEAANQCATLPFDEWLHGNISISLVATAGGVDWQSCQVCREQNGVADKLARLGQQYTQHGRIFVVPPGSVVVVVAEEYQYWEEQREAGASRF
ncbi:hypothetical protein V6N11_018538 [Hibiscus sabdariffa]|uniref:Uncharacterized protein n=1 Tax=Hibiscus sabdariffa TaxID=183260 RepID=A0ABR2T7Q6_9ROSI